MINWGILISNSNSIFSLTSIFSCISLILDFSFSLALGDSFSPKSFPFILLSKPNPWSKSWLSSIFLFFKNIL